MKPEKSQGSLKEGIWFVFNDGNTVIKIWGSCINGKEKVYLNEKLVSEKRSMRMKSEHIFSDDDGSEYKVTLITTSIMKGILECSVFHNDKHIKTFKSRFQFGKSFSLNRILLLVLATVIFMIIVQFLNLPDSSFIILFILIIVVGLRIREKDEIIIDE